MEEKQKILGFAAPKFFRDGFYKVTMDEIATELNMSKKTIYKFFRSKEELVNEGVELFLEDIRIKFENIANSDENAVIKFIKIVGNFMEMAQKISDRMLFDLQVHGRDLWKKIDDFRTNFAFKIYGKILDQGKEEKLIIDKPNPVILTIFLSAIRGVINPDFLIHNNLSMKDAGEMTIDILISGILTKKGRKVFKQYKTGTRHEL